MTTSTSTVGDVLAEHAAAHFDRDADRLVALYSAEPVVYSLAPPLQQTPVTEHGTDEGLRAWFAGFDSPIRISHQDPVVTADGDVAFVHTLTSMSAKPSGAPEPFTLWYRSTFGLRREDDRWRIAHEHTSTPFHMDGSFRAAVELEP